MLRKARKRSTRLLVLHDATQFWTNERIDGAAQWNVGQSTVVLRLSHKESSDWRSGTTVHSDGELVSVQKASRFGKEDYLLLFTRQ